MADNQHTPTTPEIQGTIALTPSAYGAAYELHGIACCAVDALRGIAQNLDPNSPDWKLCMNLDFIASGLDRAAEAFESADMDARKASEADGVAA